MMVFRTLRGPFNMGNIVLLTCGLMFVAASIKEEATQLLRPLAEPGHIEEPLITERSYDLGDNGCFEWNEIEWEGVAPTSPVATDCGLEECTHCGDESQRYITTPNTYCRGSNWSSEHNRIIEYSTLALAQQACTADAACKALNDYHGDGNGFWTCKCVSSSSDCVRVSGENGYYPLGSRTWQKVRWVDLGAGCLSFRNSYEPLFKGDVVDLNACKNKCLDYANCGFAEYGWKDSKWCYVVPYKYLPSDRLQTGYNDCGSSGNNGVHSYQALFGRYA